MTNWWARSLAFLALLAMLVPVSCSPGPNQGTTLPAPEVYGEEMTSVVNELTLVAENALGVRMSAGGYSSGRGVFIEYMLSSVPPEQDKAAAKLKQELETLGAESVQAGFVGNSLIVDFDRLPLRDYVWEGFIQVYDGHLIGYLNLVSSEG